MSNNQAKGGGQSLNRCLTFWDLMSASVGQIIGAGIMSLTGAGIALTGRSLPISFIISAVLVCFNVIPYILINSTVRLNGGSYTMISLMCSKKIGGFFVIVFTMSQLSLAMYALSAADYLMGLVGMGNRTIIALIILTLFFVLNLFGVDKFAKAQNIIVGCLVIALALFTVFGLMEVDYAHYLTDDFMTNGMMGLFKAASLLVFALGGATMVANLAGEAKNPTRDVPKAIIFSTLTVAVLYAIMGIAAAGVLPVSQTAGQSMVATAAAVLPYPLYVFFIIGGAMFALASTLNSQFASATKPLLQATWDGWFPEKWGRLSKWKSPVVFLAVLYIIGVATILTGVDISVIGSMVVLVLQVTYIIIQIAMVRLPKVIPEEWNASKFHVSDKMLYIFMVIGLATCGLNLYMNALDKAAWVLVANVVVLAVALIYSLLRYKSGKVKQEVTYEKV